MKHLSKEEFSKRIDVAKEKTKYEYVFTGLEKQTDQILVKCLKHGYEQLQRREYVFGGRKIKCCNEFSPMLETECISILKKYNTHPHIKVVLHETFHGSNTLVSVKCETHNYERIIKLESLRKKKTDIACNKCTHETMNRGHTFTAKQWEERAIKTHGDTYSYSKMEDSGLYRTITCKTHGDFQQNIHNHVYLGNGCPKCVVGTFVSSQEHEINDFLISLGFIENVDYVRSTRAIIDPYELDFYFMNKRIAIEFNGDYWHSTKIQKKKTYHQDKKIMGISKNINIIMIYQHLWNTKKDIIKNRIKAILGVEQNRTYARNTIIEPVSFEQTKEFCIAHHIQGWCVSSINYGLKSKNGNIVAIMTFGKSRFTDHDYELIRFVSDGVVVGGASKLFNHFRMTYPKASVVSYADLDWSCGNLYEVLGFRKVKNIPIDYTYVGNRTKWKRKHKFGFDKASLKSIYEKENKVYDMSLTEHILAENIELYKVYDCGHIKYQIDCL